MPAASSDSPNPPVFDMPMSHRLRMVALGYIPFLHALSVLAVLAVFAMSVFGGASRPAAWLPAWAPTWAPTWAWAGLAPVLLYLAPPIACRLAGLIAPVPEGTFEADSREFLHWWFHAQWQVIFNRFPALEEALRMVPGLYSQWLRLWGSNVGRFVYWSSGVVLLDRSCLEVGDRVVFGADVVMSPHNLSPDASRRVKLLISPIRIGHDTMIGGATVLAPGVRVGSEELVPAFYRAMPFSEWKDGKRRREGRADWATASALMSARSGRSN